MTGLVRKAALGLSVCGLLAANAAFASVPNPAQSILPSTGIYLVGFAGAVADASNGTFTVTVKDLAGNTIPSSLVTVDLSAAGDLTICATQHTSGETADIPTKSVRAFTNGAGVATFVIEGHTGGLPSFAIPGKSAKIYADGVLLGSVKAATFLYVPGTGVGAGSLSAWISDFVGFPTFAARGDYDFNGGVGSTDLSKLLTVNFSGFSVSGCP